MQINDRAVLSETAEIRERLVQLAGIEPVRGVFVSCFLDMRAGSEGRVRFLDEQATVWRDRLPHAQRRQFDESLCLVRAEMARPWSPDVNGLAIFVHGHESSCVATAAEITNRLNAYDRPDLVPLIGLLQRERPRWPIEVKARRITRAALKTVPDVVSGAVASRSMLRAGLVKTLLVVPDLVCEDSPQNAHQPLTDLVHMASQRGVEVLVSSAEELRELGGVACLLAEPAEYHLMPAPATARTPMPPMGLAA